MAIDLKTQPRIDEQWKMPDYAWDAFTILFQQALDMAILDLTKFDNDMSHRQARELVWKRLKVWMGER